MSGLFRKVKKWKAPERPQEAPVGAPKLPEPPVVLVPAPRPVAAPFAAPKAGWPDGAYEFPKAGSGNWYVPVNGTNAGPFKDPAEFADWVAAVGVRDDNLRKWQEAYDAEVHVGTSGIEAASLSMPERVWLKVKSEGFHGDLHRIVLSGTNQDISRVINDGEYLKNNYWPVNEVEVRQKLIDAVNRALGA